MLLPKRSQAPNSPNNAIQPPGVSRFFRDLLGLEDDQKSKFPDLEKISDEIDLSLVDRHLCVDSLSLHLQYYFAKEKPNCNAVAMAYFKLQVIILFI